MEIDVAKLRAMLKDHAPLAYHQREQAAIAAVWEALPELLAVYQAWREAPRAELQADNRLVAYGSGGQAALDAFVGQRVRVLPE